MKKILKKILLQFPPINRYVVNARNLRLDNTNKQEELNSLKKILGKSRSPGLLELDDDYLTERLLAHPALSPLPSLNLRSEPATSTPDRIIICERLIAAYHKSLKDEANSPMKREGEDLWSGLLRNELPSLMEAIDKKDAQALSNFLLNFGDSYVWFGGITTCIDGYNKNLNPTHIALTYFDKLVCLAEYLGVLQYENPECGPWGENLRFDPNIVIEKIQQSLGISISPPMGAIHTDGLDTSFGLFHYRHINSLYSAIRLKELNENNLPCLEFGGGLGITAMYASQLGIKNYTMLDLPITCLLAGNYLLNTLGMDSVSLYGEEQKNSQIKILPYWECLTLPQKSIHSTLNQDSFPEIADNLLKKYLEVINRVTTDNFISINHETFYPRTVNNFVSEWTQFKKIYRSKYWMREGYIEELWKI
jgi:hypothetical protein